MRVPLEWNQSNARSLAQPSGYRRVNQWEPVMLGWALTFLLVALVAAVLGFGGIATFAVDIAKIIFFVAIILFAIAAVVGLIRGQRPTMP